MVRDEIMACKSSKVEIMCGEKAEILDCLRDSSVALGVSQPRAPVWINNIAHKPSEKALVWDAGTILKSGAVETTLLTRDLEKKWGANWGRCEKPEIKKVQQILQWRTNRRMIASPKYQERPTGEGSFDSKSPRVKMPIEERNRMFTEAIRAIERA